jgi:tetratricopeptide (TPR) repeat protein
MTSAEHFAWPEEFERLQRYMEAKQGRWGLFLMLYRHASDRAAAAQAFEATWPGSRQLEASERHTCWMDLEHDLAALSGKASAIQVMGLERWLDVDEEEETSRRLGHLNMRRDPFAARVPCPILFWLTPKALRQLAHHAKDLWSWRTAHFRFLNEDAQLSLPRHRGKDLGRFLHRDIDDRSEAFKQRRLGEWCLHLHELEPHAPTGSLRWGRYPIEDMVGCATSLGDWQDADDLVMLELVPRARAAGDELGLAEAHGWLADLRMAQERFDDAVRHRRVQIRLLRRINAMNSHERALAALAHDLLAQGDVRQARRLWDRGFMRTYVARGNRKFQAFTKADLIRCLLASVRTNDTELKNAERILRAEVLPDMPDLAGERATAITLDLLADVLERRGELDDALRVRRREVIPMLAVHSDPRLIAWVKCKIADGYAVQGRFEDAIALRADEVIPVFRYLGDKPALAVVEADQAIDRTALADMNAALAAMRGECGECGESTLNPDRT